MPSKQVAPFRQTLVRVGLTSSTETTVHTLWQLVVGDVDTNKHGALGSGKRQVFGDVDAPVLEAELGQDLLQRVTCTTTTEHASQG